MCAAAAASEKRAGMVMAMAVEIENKIEGERAGGRRNNARLKPQRCVCVCV